MFIRWQHFFFSYIVCKINLMQLLPQASIMQNTNKALKAVMVHCIWTLLCDYMRVHLIHRAKLRWTQSVHLQAAEHIWNGLGLSLWTLPATSCLEVLPFPVRLLFLKAKLKMSQINNDIKMLSPCARGTLWRHMKLKRVKFMWRRIHLRTGCAVSNRTRPWRMAALQSARQRFRRILQWIPKVRSHQIRTCHRTCHRTWRPHCSYKLSVL